MNNAPLWKGGRGAAVAGEFLALSCFEVWNPPATGFHPAALPPLLKGAGTAQAVTGGFF